MKSLLALWVLLATGLLAQTAIPIAHYTIAGGLPTASANKNRSILITDGATACDVATGSGTTYVYAISNGTAWVAVNCGGGGGGSPSETVTAGTGGVTLNYLAAKDTSAPTKFIIAPIGACGLGFAQSTVSASATFTLNSGAGTVQTGVADGTITAGHLLVGGASTAGRVADSGFAGRSSIQSTVCIVGVALASATVGNTVSLLYDGAGSFGTAGSITVAPYTTTTITSSPMSISAATHGQGQYAFPICWSTSSNPQVEESCNWSRNPATGDLTVTYGTAPGQIDIFGSTGKPPYSTSTITSSPMTIAATTHLQGIYSFAQCWSTSSNPQTLQACNWSRNPTSGDLTITYATAPGQIDVFGGWGGTGGGSGGGGGSVTSATIGAALYCPDTSGSANTITCSPTTAYTSYAAGTPIIVKLANTVTGATTINVNSIGSKSVTKNGTTAIASGDMVASGLYLLTYDGTEFVAYLVSGGGATAFTGLTDNAGSISSNVFAMAAGGAQNPLAGTYSYLAGTGTITVNSGSDTGQFGVGYNASLQRICWVDSGSITLGDYTVSSGTGGFGGACSSSKPSGAVYTSTFTVASGVMGTVTDRRQQTQAAALVCGTNLTVSGTGTGCMVDVTSSLAWTGPATFTTLGTATNCANGASPAVCSAASAGAVAIPVGVNPTLVVDTSAVTSTSRILITNDSSVTISSTTCNTTAATLAVLPYVSARTGGTSFTLSFLGTITTNPLCVVYQIIN